MELFEAHLTDEQLTQLCTELDTSATISKVKCRPGDSVDVEMRVAIRGLMARELSAVQVTYCYQEQVWCDTFIREANLTKLMRWGPAESI